MTSILKTPPIQRSEKKVQVNDNHRSTSGQIAFPPLPIMRDTQTALSPPPLSLRPGCLVWNRGQVPADFMEPLGLSQYLSGFCFFAVLS